MFFFWTKAMRWSTTTARGTPYTEVRTYAVSASTTPVTPSLSTASMTCAARSASSGGSPVR
jgi:hypothetical protein